MNGNTVWCNALHEMRSHRRLVRTHIFVWIALVVCSLYYLGVATTHMQSASEIPMLGIISPRYIVSLLSGSFVALFCIGVLILTFDLVGRDNANRIHEVMCSKPVRNIELLVGQLLGVMMTMAIPLLCFLVVIVSYGVIAESFSLSFGEPIVPMSVVALVLLDVVPNFAFFGSLAILIAVLSKSRLAAIFITAFCVGALFWINSRLPLNVAAPLHTVSGNVVFASELTPSLLTPTIVMNRITLLLMSIGFLYWSSSLEKRLNPTRFRELALGCTCACLGLIVFGSLIGIHIQEHRNIDRWIRVHNEHFIPNAFPDVENIRGNIDIEPGRTLSLDLTMEVNIDPSQESDYVIFSLNPGYEISRLSVAGVQVTDQDFRHGLLKIPRQYFTVGTNSLQLAARGRPDSRFAYLDSIDTIAQVEGPDIRQLRLLGTENSIFRRNFVVLLPGIKWYPTSGTSTKEDFWERRERDFFTVEVSVTVPKRWIVAGPAKREAIEDDNRNTYRFEQSNPIPEFALVGSKFESASMDVDGIQFEVLFSLVHSRTFKAIAQAEEDIRDRLQQNIEEVRSQGMDYNYGSYSLVEVPSTLRVYGGGVSMDTVMCPPGMLMVRESSLPTYPNASRFNDAPLEQTDDIEQDWVASPFSELIAYVRRTNYESSTSYVFYRNLLVQQMNATQEGASATNSLLALLSEAMFPFWRADFDFDLALNRDILDLTSLNPIHFLGSNMRWRMFSESVEMMRKTHAIRTAPDVWDTVASFSLLDAEQHAIGSLELLALRFRTERVVQLLRDAVGTEELAPIVADLTNRFRGKNLRFEDFVSVFSEYGIDLEEIAGDLLSKASLPGFIASEPTSKKLPGLERPRYESSFVLQNDQQVSGPVRLSLAYENADPYLGPSNSISLRPILVGAAQAVRVVIESSKPVQHIWVHPYLSLNRKLFRVDLPGSGESQSQELDPDDDAGPVIKAIEIVDVKQPESSSITIDDLDPEFSISDHGDTSILSDAFTQFSRRLLGVKDSPLDNGLPVYKFTFTGRPMNWSRKSEPTAFGTYRRTFVLTSAVDRPVSAKFSATLPHIGSWKLEYYLPDKNIVEEIHLGGTWSTSLMFPQNVRTIQLEIYDGSTRIPQSIDATNLSMGWHTIGTFDISHTDVDVLVSNETDSRRQTVFADAIRWTPIDSEE
ncbi:MAG: ABC transporter permease subunit [Gammaproteobacteria bacterium]|nr:ABC transporter permease subunit [Gammaproteobacteria bacterium]MYF38132.1 ABC transporter permease subunit [Gammaproteobacteria bacterium]